MLRGIQCLNPQCKQMTSYAKLNETVSPTYRRPTDA
jgi:hypothetical protein